MSFSETNRKLPRIFPRNKGFRTLWEGPEGTPSVLVRSTVLFGITCVITGGWCCAQAAEPFTFAGEIRRYGVPGRILLFSGSMLFALGLVTIYAAGTMIRLILITLSQGLYLVLVLDAVAGATSYAFSTVISSGALERSLTKDVTQEYGRSPRITLAFDLAQKQFNCCGIMGPEDWNATYWANRTYGANVKVTEIVPLACCLTEGNICQSRSPDVRKQGCLIPTTKSVVLYLRSVTRCAFICIVIHHSLCMVILLLERRA